MIVLGIDPSLCNTGIAAVQLGASGERIVETQVIRTAPSAKKRHVLKGDDNARRIAELATGLQAAIVKHKPAALVVEVPAGSKGAQAARALGLAFGAVVAVATVCGLPLVQVSPLDVKRATCGRKEKVDKADVICAVELRYAEVKWPEPASVVEHAADAIGAVMAAFQSDVIRMARRAA